MPDEWQAAAAMPWSLTCEVLAEPPLCLQSSRPAFEPAPAATAEVHSQNAGAQQPEPAWWPCRLARPSGSARPQTQLAQPPRERGCALAAERKRQPGLCGAGALAARQILETATSPSHPDQERSPVRLEPAASGVADFLASRSWNTSRLAEWHSSHARPARGYHEPLRTEASQMRSCGPVPRKRKRTHLTGMVDHGRLDSLRPASAHVPARCGTGAVGAPPRGPCHSELVQAPVKQALPLRPAGWQGAAAPCAA